MEGVLAGKILLITIFLVLLVTAFTQKDIVDIFDLVLLVLGYLKFKL